ncbi:MAG: GTP-binding protein [Planctomycetota bacterium]
MNGVPVTILAGFLGSGKTTLLNRILSGPEGRGCAVVVNEFGEMSVDGLLVVSSDEEVLELANGCVCCTVRGDLVRTVRELLARAERKGTHYTRIVVEASGLASPGPVHQTFRLDPVLAAATRPARIVTVVHAAHVGRQLEEYAEAAEQIGFADAIVLGHVDEVDAAAADAAEARCRSINTLAPIRRAVRGELDVASLLDGGDADPERWRLVAATSASHTSRVSSVVLEHGGPVDLHRLKIWLQFVAARRDWDVLRMKGVVRAKGRNEAVVVQAVHQVLEIGPGPGPAPPRSAIVVIGRDLDEGVLRTGWDRVVSD